MKKKLVIITPTYNNSGSIKLLLEKVTQISKNLPSYFTEILFIDDGSKDSTVNEIKLYANIASINIKLVELSRNFGSYNSLLAGISLAQGDVFVYLHADLQDPPELIPKMLKHYENGFELVIANRVSRTDGGVFSGLYHWVVKNFGIKNIPKGGFDLILFTENIKQQIAKIAEKNTNTVYLISWLGYPYVSIPYTRQKREFGKSQWRFWKKVKLFVDTIFSFTVIPLLIIRLITIIALISISQTIYTHFSENGLFQFYLLFKNPIFLIGLLMLLFEIIAEYIWRIHETVRNRPNFVIKKQSVYLKNDKGTSA